MKKFISQFCIFCTIMVPLQAVTYLTPGQISGSRGQVVDVPVYFSSDDPIVGAEFILHYDENFLKIGGIKKGSSIADHEIFDDQDTAGELKLTILSMKNELLYDGNLTVLSFSILQDLSQATENISLDENSTLLVSKAAQSFDYEKIEAVTELSLDFVSTLDATRPAAGRNISFNAGSDGPLTSYSWDMGDGTVLSGDSLSYAFAKPDTYLVTITGTNPFGSVKETLQVSVNSPYWDLDAEDLGNGWKSFDWFGTFYDETGSFWIYHKELGWMYRHGENVDNTWLWTERWNWTWASDQIYPYLAKTTGEWLYYFKGTSDPIRYYDFNLGEWLEN